jgi:hypothetical protein
MPAWNDVGISYPPHRVRESKELLAKRADDAGSGVKLTRVKSRKRRIS